MLGNLDILEDHPNYYQRRIETVRKVDSEADGKTIIDYIVV